MSKLLLCLLVTIFLIACDSPSSSNTRKTENEPVIDKSIRVISINVWSGLDYKGLIKLGEYQDHETHALRTLNLVSQLKDLNPDIIALNEANKLPAYARSLAGELGYEEISHVGIGGVRVGPVGLPVNLREGDAILANESFSLTSIGRIQLSGGYVGRYITFHFSDATQIIGGKIVVNQQEVLLFNTHWHASQFPSEEYFQYLDNRLETNDIDRELYEKLRNDALEGQKRRLDESKRTVAFINSFKADLPVILMGDFNALDDSEEIKVLTDAGFHDSFKLMGKTPGYTWDGTRNGNIQLQKQTYPDDFPLEPTRKRIDYIFFRGSELELLSSQVVLDNESGGVFPSDHFGVMAEFSIK